MEHGSAHCIHACKIWIFLKKFHRTYRSDWSFTQADDLEQVYHAECYKFDMNFGKLLLLGG
jgi:hypothetical protein